ncbi:MAG: DUF483 domain-containing protein [bacterium]
MREGFNLSPEELSNPEKKEKVELKHRDVYNSPEWKTLNPITRAHLILVAEGAKNGAYTRGDYKNFASIIDKLGLEASMNSEEGDLDPVFTVAKPEAMSENIREEIMASDKKESLTEGFKREGKFLGYPDCCVTEYERASLVEYETGEKNVNIDQEIEEAGTYPKELDYLPPTFTPCSVDCEKALAMAEKHKDILLEADPEAAEEIRKINILGYPEVNKDEIEKLEQDENEAEKLEFLRRTAKGEMLEWAWKRLQEERDEK